MKIDFTRLSARDAASVLAGDTPHFCLSEPLQEIVAKLGHLIFLHSSDYGDGNKFLFREAVEVHSDLVYALFDLVKPSWEEGQPKPPMWDEWLDARTSVDIGSIC